MRIHTHAPAVPNMDNVRISAAPRRFVVSLVIGALAILAVLVLTQPAPVGTQARPAGNDQLALTWVDGDGHLQVDGAGYRAKATADVRLGSDSIQQVRADDRGRIRVRVPRALVAAGRPGLSIVVDGRSKFGTSRTLVSAVPPQAAGSSLADWLPWIVAAAMISCAGLTLLRRRRHRAAASLAEPAPAPRGYLPLHRA